MHLSILGEDEYKCWDLCLVKTPRKGSSGMVWVLQKFHCNLSDLQHLWLQFLLTTHTKWSIICNFAWTKLFEAFNNSKCILYNFKHSDLHIIGLRASFWSRTLHKLVIPFIQAYKKWYLIEMAFWRYKTKKFSFFPQ